MKYRIRPAVTDDSAQLVILLGELGYPSTSDFILEKLTQLSSTLGTKILVADWDGTVIGLLCFSIVPLLHCKRRTRSHQRASGRLAVQGARHRQTFNSGGRRVCLGERLRSD